MKDNESASTSVGFQSSSSPNLAPRLLRSLSKTQPTQQITSVGGAEQTSVASITGWMSKQKVTAIEHFQVTHRAAQVGAATDSVADHAEWSSQTLHSIQTPTDTGTNEGNVDSVVADGPPVSTVPSTFAKKIQDILSTFPSFSPSIASGSSRPTPSALPQTEAHDPPSPVRDFTTSLTLPNFENGPSEHGWQSFWSTLDRLRPPYGKQPEPASTSEPSQDEVLDCVDDNNSIMMYGPLEPDDDSEVEIACSEIVSINGDGEEIRTPQPCFIPLPSESFDEVVVGSPGLSPLPRFIPLPFESIDQVLAGGGGRSPQSRLSPLPLESINRMLIGGGGRSPQPCFVPLPLGSIDQALTSGGGESSSIRWKEDESEPVSEATGATRVPLTAEPTGDQPSVKEYRVWLPSLTKISVQTMWWGFRM